jgi:hypothetical protein
MQKEKNKGLLQGFRTGLINLLCRASNLEKKTALHAGNMKFNPQTEE